MTQTFLNAIYEYYSSGGIESVKHRKIRETRRFYKAYIQSLLQTDRKAGFQMEAMFNAALAESAKMEYINGFKSCMRFLLESLV